MQYAYILNVLWARFAWMTRKQDGSSNQRISVYTAILLPENIQQHLKALKAANVYCPSLQ